MKRQCALLLLALVLDCSPATESAPDALFLAVSSDTTPEPIRELELVVRRIGPDGAPELFGQSATHRLLLPIPDAVDLRHAPWIVRTTTDNPEASGRVYLVARGRSVACPAGERVCDAPVAAFFAGIRDLGARAVQPLHLVATSPACDPDQDGFPDCDTTSCCPGDDTEDAKALRQHFSDCRFGAQDAATWHPLAVADPDPVLDCVQCIPSAAISWGCEDPATCVDTDEDGVEDCRDCHPGDGAIHPGAAETCNAKDDDCDGKTDNVAPLTVDQCDAESRAKAERGVCAGKATPRCEGAAIRCVLDTAAIAGYEPTEAACDGLDNDCDGLTDEDLAGCGGWTGDWDGDHVTGEGDCRPYDAAYFAGNPSAACCATAPGEAPWECDFDCDGAPNLCEPGDADGDGVSTPADCDDANAQAFPGAPEKCGDGVDQDCAGGDLACDGVVDGDGDGYSPGADCDDGDEAVHPGASEACNGADDDCDGAIDEGNPGGGAACVNPTERHYGVCLLEPNLGTAVCAHGLDAADAPESVKAQAAGAKTAVLCVDYYEPPLQESLCDGVNEDCDCVLAACDDAGSADEDFELDGLFVGDACGIGACAGGKIACGPAQLVCSSAAAAQPEELSACDGVDNDCDGSTDGWIATDYASTTCPQEGVCLAQGDLVVATCQKGLWACDFAQVVGYEPQQEGTCDGLDNDCDGETDEYLTWQGVAVGDPCDGIGQCGVGLVMCATDGSATCSTNPDGSQPGNASELCNLKDDDCDGETDEGFSAKGAPCAKGFGDCQVTGNLVCSAGGEVCDVTGAPTSTACDDGDLCTHSDHCSGGDASTCAGQPAVCSDDGLACTDNVCNGDGCTSVLQAGFCKIAGSCVTAGQSNPLNACQTCDPAKSTSDWVNKAAGTACDDGNTCTSNDKCTAGQCAGAGLDCNDGLDCTQDACDGTKCNALHPVKPGSCLIGGVCYADGQQNPVNSCQVCNSAKSSSAFTNGVDDVPCDDGKKCTLEATCQTGTCQELTVNPCDDGNECTDDVCNESAAPDGCTHTNNTQPCASDGLTCTKDVCAAGACTHTALNAGKCLIQGVCYSDGAANPGKPCSVCKATAPTVWSNAAANAVCDDVNGCTKNDKCTAQGACVGTALTSLDCTDNNKCTIDFCSGTTGCDHQALDGTSCDDDGIACTEDKCANGTCAHTKIDSNFCLIGGACITTGTNDPANQCKACTPTSSQSAYTTKANTTPCNDGKKCTQSDTCQSGACTGANPNGCDDFKDCTDDICNESAAPDGCTHTLKSFTCLIDGTTCAAGGTLNPANSCQSCVPGTSTSQYTKLSAGAACDSDSVSCTSDTCDGNGVCLHPLQAGKCNIAGVCYSQGDADPTNECRECDASVSSVAFTSTADGTLCANGTCKSGECLSYVKIPAGSFTMGSPATEPGHIGDEQEHAVTISKPFWLKATEVTQAEWQDLMGNNPSYFSTCGTSCPVETVSWWDAVAYCNKLSQSEGLSTCYTLTGCTGTPGDGVYKCTEITFAGLGCTGYHLPTEAEWEYAARASTIGSTYNGTMDLLDCEQPNSVLDPIGWFCGNSISSPHAVAQKQKNAWGLYDMAGNVYEWCGDWYASSLGAATDPTGPTTGTTRVRRGASWDSGAIGLRSAYRNYSKTPADHVYILGFRPARSIP